MKPHGSAAESYGSLIDTLPQVGTAFSPEPGLTLPNGCHTYGCPV